jgi:hypothetical protein
MSGYGDLGGGGGFGGFGGGMGGGMVRSVVVPASRDSNMQIVAVPKMRSSCCCACVAERNWIDREERDSNLAAIHEFQAMIN